MGENKKQKTEGGAGGPAILNVPRRGKKIHNNNKNNRNSARGRRQWAAASLKMLNLYNNQIGDAGATALADVCAKGVLASLKELYLNSNQIGDAGATALADTCAKGAPALLKELDATCTATSSAHVQKRHRRRQQQENHCVPLRA